jgi:CRISPR/Cas system-associated exonuclease Cas4 (RecB family)
MDATSQDYQISPSSWNRFEECPRKYWLSRQRLPRKASMPASLGTAIHNSVEDLCNLELSNREGDEVGWLQSTARDVLEGNWEAERKEFMGTPRHPRWKPEMFPKAFEGLVGALSILFEKAALPKSELTGVSIQSWRKVQAIILATEATLESDCGRLLGRLDLLILDKESEGKEGWIVADLKTGKPPRTELSEKVSRQLLFYRDLMKQRNPEHPPVITEGWYSSNQTVYSADGPSILEEAIEAWKLMELSETPFHATPSQAACSFCEWKAWCPKWWIARYEGQLDGRGIFRDEVVSLVRLDRESGAALFERTTPIGEDGELNGSDYRFGAILKDQALEQIKQLEQVELDDHLFLGSVRVDGKIVHMGDWSEIIPWSPILRSTSD